MSSPWSNKTMSEVSLRHIDKSFLPKTPQQIEFIVKEMLLNDSNKILDLGCGAGRHAISLAKEGINVTGVDISEYMLLEAKMRAKKAGVKVNFIQADLADINKLNLRKNSFNGAICLNEAGIGVLGSLEKELKFFKEIYRVLQDDSKLVISCFNGLRRYLMSKDENPKFDFIKGEFTWSADVAKGLTLNEVQRMYIPSELNMLLSLAGFRDIKVHSCKDGVFTTEALGFDEIEMLLIASK